MHTQGASGGRASWGRGEVRSFALLAALVTALVLSGLAPPPANAVPSSEPVWGEGTVWEVLMPGGSATLKGKTAKPFYLIAPIDAAQPQSLGRWGFGPHDQVTAVPPYRHGTGGGACVVSLVVPGPAGVPGVNVDVVRDPELGTPFVRAADLDGDGTLEPLTSVAAVDSAASSGVVSLFTPKPGGEPIAFRCPVRPLRG